jgi:hypothetical protein
MEYPPSPPHKQITTQMKQTNSKNNTYTKQKHVMIFCSSMQISYGFIYGGIFTTGAFGVESPRGGAIQFCGYML